MSSPEVALKTEQNMKTKCLLPLFILLITSSMAVAMVAPCKKKKKAMAKVETAKFSDVISDINASLLAANMVLDTAKLKIKTADVSLKTAGSLSGGGSIQIFVKASHSWQLEKAGTIKYSYSEVVDKGMPEMISSTVEDLRDNIIAAAKIWNDPNMDITGLKKDKFTVDISFGLKKTTSGGFEFEPWGFGAEISAEYANTATHTISLTFGPVDEEPEPTNPEEWLRKYNSRKEKINDLNGSVDGMVIELYNRSGIKDD